MQFLIILLRAMGIIFSALGIIPFFFPYPYSNNAFSSGPRVLWELIVVASYEGENWYFLMGISFLLLVYVLKKRKD